MAPPQEQGTLPSPLSFMPFLFVWLGRLSARPVSSLLRSLLVGPSLLADIISQGSARAIISIQRGPSSSISTTSSRSAIIKRSERSCNPVDLTMSSPQQVYLLPLKDDGAPDVPGGYIYRSQEPTSPAKLLRRSGLSRVLPMTLLT